MALNQHIEKDISRIHTQQVFDKAKPSLDHIVESLHLLPKEAGYIVDAHKDEVICIGNWEWNQVLKLVGDGISSQRISSMLFIAKEPVERHRKNIIKKLEASNSIQAYNKAIDIGLFKC